MEWVQVPENQVNEERRGITDMEGIWDLGVLWWGFGGCVRVSLYFGERRNVVWYSGLRGWSVYRHPWCEDSL